MGIFCRGSFGVPYVCGLDCPPSGPPLVGVLSTPVLFRAGFRYQRGLDVEEFGAVGPSSWFFISEVHRGAPLLLRSAERILYH